MKTVLLLVCSNIFMTLAWYGHLKFKFLDGKSVWCVILFSWGIAFFEYCLMVPANRSGYFASGFSGYQLKIIQECVTLTLPKAQAAGMGVIAKRPIANVAWRSGDKQPDSAYIQAYWERLRKLDYDFLKSDAAVATALRFTLSLPGVWTAIVGTTKPDRWQSNAHLLEAGPLPQAQIDAIRARWQEVSEKSWVGQG